MEAEEVYDMGMRKGAEPKERLIRAYECFIGRRNEKGFGGRVQTENKPTMSLAAELMSSKKDAKMAVFRDEYEDNNKINPFPDAKEQVWDDFGDLEQGRKENKKNIQVMAGSVLMQNKALQQKTTTNSEPSEGFGVFSDEQHKTKVKKETKEILVCDLSLVYIGDDEFSFEEIRALRLGYLLDDDEDELPKKKTTTILPVRVPLAQKIIHPSSTVSKKVAMPLFHQPASFNSPTINTKAAIADVFGMFNQPIECEVEEDMTITSKIYKQDIHKLNIFSDEPVNYFPGTRQFKRILTNSRL